MGIEIKNITKKYGKKTAIDNVSLELESGKIYGLLGRNGAGKSTLLNIIDGRCSVNGGEIYIDKKLCRPDDSLFYDNVFLVSEDNLYPPEMSIREIVNQIKKFHSSFDSEKAFRLLEKFGLHAKMRIKALSTGGNTAFKDVIGLCINLPYVFFDEPTLGLDAVHREMFYKLLLEQYSEGESTFVLTTHLISEISNIIEKLVIINDGKILLNDDCSNVLESSFCISGDKILLDELTDNKKIISTEYFGNNASYYIIGSEIPNSTAMGVDIKKLSLQDLFIKLTKNDGRETV